MSATLAREETLQSKRMSEIMSEQTNERMMIAILKTENTIRDTAL